jgi:hypothetical protein
MVGFILLGTGVVSMAVTASLLTGLLWTARAASSVTEEEQHKLAGRDGQDWKEAESDEDAPRGAA